MGICIEEGCKTKAAFNYIGGDSLYCSKHKKINMIDIKRKRCRCGKSRPNFNYKEEKSAICCNSCKEENMINITNKNCNCGSGYRVIYNYKGKKKPICCSSCKKDDMIDITRKLCICGKVQPSFNYKGEKKPICCSSCKEENMINIVCKNCNCGSGYRVLYNYKGKENPICCYSCKKDNMINSRQKLCMCGKVQPSFNYKGEKKPICCSSCKEENMINIVGKNCKCGKARPHFNYKEEKSAICCASCKEENMIDVVSKKCKSEWCDKHIVNKYDGYCLRCFMYLFPDKPVARNYKTKEFAVVEYIKNYFQDVDWIADKIVNGGCSKRRPDLILDLGYQVLIIEIDENKHSGYDCSCDNKRLMQLSQDVGHRPIIFIRFNPDAYTNNNGTKIKSCWTTNGYGICVVDKSKKTEWQERLDCLKDQVEYWIDNSTQKTIEVIELFY